MNMVASLIPSKSPRYIVVLAPGHYGDVTRVLSSHASASAALRAVGGNWRYVVRQSESRKGDRWLRVYEETSPIVERF